MNNTNDSKLRELSNSPIVPPGLAITAMRDSGYKNTAYALSELIDNSVQAKASKIGVIAIEKPQLVNKRESTRLFTIGVLDNGVGMDVNTLTMALQFGNGTRLDSREGIGRFGMGLPNASISQASRVDVWSWQNGPSNAIRTFIDTDMIKKGQMENVPKPQHYPLPQEWRMLPNGIGESGTLVIWSKLCFDRLTWKKAKHLFENTEWIVGRVHRRAIIDRSIEIYLFSKNESDGDELESRKVNHNDPLYLTPSPKLPAPFNKEPMFEEVSSYSESIEYKGKTHEIQIRFSVASNKTVDEAKGRDRGSTKYGKDAEKNMGLSVLRAGRELMIDRRWCLGYDPRDRWWGAEINFPPELDELFGVTNNKQDAIHFSELAGTDWKEFAEQGGQTLLEVAEHLREEGDQRGWLLIQSDKINRMLNEMRGTIKEQTAGQRSSRKKRHDEPDDATKIADKGWKNRARERSVKGDSDTLTNKVLKNIRDDLIQGKKYSERQADEIISLIKSKDLKVYFSENSFPNSYDLFDVEMREAITGVILNRKHPAFNYILGTASTGEEDINNLSKEEVIERLTQAVNATKILLAAWARYERESGVGYLPKSLEKIRFDWGYIAASFLDHNE